MKKIVLFLLAILTISSISQGQLLGKKELKKHESEPGYFWFKPVIDVDTTTLLEGGGNFNTNFLVEGNLSTGEPIQLLVKGSQLRFLLNLPEKKDAEYKPVYTGFMFTVKSLGQKSFFKKRYIQKGNFFEKQKDRLIREKDTEKYELWSESPTKVKGRLLGKKIVPIQEVAENTLPDKKQEEKKIQAPDKPAEKPVDPPKKRAWGT